MKLESHSQLVEKFDQLKCSRFSHKKIVINIYTEVLINGVFRGTIGMVEGMKVKKIEKVVKKVLTWI